MKVCINDLGELCVSAESQLEFYALNMWYKNMPPCVKVANQQGGESNLVINTITYTDDEIIVP